MRHGLDVRSQHLSGTFYAAWHAQRQLERSEADFESRGPVVVTLKNWRRWCEI